MNMLTGMAPRLRAVLVPTTPPVRCRGQEGLYSRLTMRAVQSFFPTNSSTSFLGDSPILCVPSKMWVYMTVNPASTKSHEASRVVSSSWGMSKGGWPWCRQWILRTTDHIQPSLVRLPTIRPSN
ncbi:uncharacterized protein PV06_09350 [Exophiala oligosperma]|uniref:Uncharacterized protein n=1 Tax=Exophiala oligosperma TaxID=215243 RepID=A0A0D2DRM7_9EURO|nr:uncharacterized protein PV06_09350 [Exophiala oligosperma]KIW38379.1 hypothetical protein PV06_09350 [Exophiala oligosperma]